MKTYTIKEIKFYLDGCRLNDGNGVPSKNYNLALDGAIAFLEEKESGIQAVLDMEEWLIHKMPLDKYIGVPCAMVSEKDGQQRGCTCVIKKIDNKKRKLLIHSGSCTFWVSTKSFFDKWMWGEHCAVKAKNS
ncbi:MAG: hypothetical protein M0R32_10190 [Candidatus Cloacimonetes bacterium]|jgi:hypothetical protein|nr:hypothetical protein [Candidatus Cloacimonadota bacterium]